MPDGHRLAQWIAWILLAAAAGLFLRVGLLVLPADLAQADPPAHFTTGVMLHDFLRHPGSQPVRFAECFYVKYPKVAFGHWPPVFYVLEALWFFIFGTKIIAAKWLCGLIAAACAAVLFLRICRFEDWPYAALFSAVFLASPFVEREGWRIMSDLLVALLVFLALTALSDYFAGGNGQDAWRFAAWSVLAILTKPTAWLLLGVMIAGPALSRRTKLYTSANYWLPLVATGAAAAPFFLGVGALQFGYPLRLAGLLHRLAAMSGNISSLLWAGILLVTMLAAAALFWWLHRDRKLGAGSVQGVVFLLWIAAQFALLLVAPLTREWDRYFLASFAPAIFLLARGTATVERQFAAKGFGHTKIAAALVCAGAVAVGATVNPVRTTAFSQAAAALPIRPEPVFIAVESDSAGEGALIAKRLEQDRYRSSFLVRGSKLLSVSDWSRTTYQLRYRDPAAVRQAIDENRVDFAVIDTSAPAMPSTPLLESALADSAWRWTVTERIPVVLGRRRGELRVYRRDSPKPAGQAHLSVELGPERGGRIVTCEER